MLDVISITFTSAYLNVNQSRTGMKHMITQESPKTMLRWIQARDRMHGLSSRHDSHPGAHIRHSYESSYLLGRPWKETPTVQRGYNTNIAAQSIDNVRSSQERQQILIHVDDNREWSVRQCVVPRQPIYCNMKHNLDNQGNNVLSDLLANTLWLELWMYDQHINAAILF